MNHLDFEQVVKIHLRAIKEAGGSEGFLNEGALRSAIAQPEGSFGGVELYPSIPEKAAACCWFIAKAHAFVDGNKRAAYGAMEHFLILNGYHFLVPGAEGDKTIRAMLDGSLSREGFITWVEDHIESLP